MQDHAEKWKGFAATLATIAPQLSLLPVLETHDTHTGPDSALRQKRIG